MPRTQSDPSSPPSPNGAAAPRVSSAASWEGSSPFNGNPGPRFDAEAAQQEERATPLAVLDVFWQEGRVRTILRAQGLLTHEAIGVADDDWAWRAHELEAISEPLANVLNKFPVTRAAAAVSDELTVGSVMFEYSARSIRDRAREIRRRRAAAAAEHPPAPAPITGYAPQDVGAVPATPAAVPAQWEVPND